MSHRIKVSMYQSLYEQVKKLASNIGMPVSTVISMMITDTNLRNMKVTPDGITKLTDGRKAKKEVNITISDETYNRIIEIVDEIPHYNIRDYVVDCIMEQLENFDQIKDASLNKVQQQRKRITGSENRYSNRKRYSEEARKKYKNISPLDGYINDIGEISNIKPNYVKKYFLAKQINQELSRYTGGFSELILDDDYIEYL